MDWYLVIKTIKGRQYYYKQKTYRVGRHVRTQNIYVGPVRNGRPAMPVRGGWTSGHIDTTGAVTLPLPFGASVAVAPLAIDVESCPNTLMGEKSSRWGHAWDKHRRKTEGTRVVHDERIDDALKRLEVQWSHKDSGCWYMPSKDIVNIPQEYRFFDTPEQTATQAYHVVVFHELMHWTRRRVKRDPFTGIGVGFQGRYAAEELVAELGALTLMKCFGKEVGDEKRHANYFQHWQNNLPEAERERAVQYAKEEAAKAVKWILENAKVAI